jgi:hypothetical protein
MAAPYVYGYRVGDQREREHFAHCWDALSRALLDLHQQSAIPLDIRHGRRVLFSPLDIATCYVAHRELLERGAHWDLVEQLATL